MITLPKLQMEGRLVRDPELRFLPDGRAVCDFTIVAQDQRKTDAGSWEDVGDPLFVRVTAWRTLAEHCSESLSKNDLVIVIGKLQNRKWEGNDGQVRQSLEMLADTVAVSLKFRTVKHGAAERGSARQTEPEDPWAHAAPAGDEESPPF